METANHSPSALASVTKASELRFRERYPAMARVETDEERAARELRESQAAERRQRAVRHTKLAQLTAAAGARYANCTLANFKITNDRQRTAVEALADYADELDRHTTEGVGLLLFGPVGCGKDHLVFAISREAILQHGLGVKWVNGQNWFGSIRDAMGDDGEKESAMIKLLAAPPILVITDPLPPAGALSPHQSTMLYRLVDARYSGGLATFVTLNVANDQEADARLGAAVWDRLCHGALKVHCEWGSHRRPWRQVNC